MTTKQQFEDLPRLTDPIADMAIASADDQVAQRLLAELQVQGDPTVARRDRRGVRRLVALAAAIAALVGLLTFTLPFGSGTAPADALQQATDLLRASSSGRATSIETRVLDGQEATATTSWEWNGDDSHGRTDYVGSYEQYLGAKVTVFTPDSFETYNVGSTVLMSLDDEPFRPANSFGPSPQDGALERFDRLIGAVESLGSCDNPGTLASPVEGADVTSYCGSGAGAEFYNRVASTTYLETFDAGLVSVRVDIDNTTGIVTALSIEVVDLIQGPLGPPEVDFGDLQVAYDRVVEQITWHDLGEDIAIVLPATG